MNKKTEQSKIIPDNKISQEEINKALWEVCDNFRGTISSDIYKDLILTLLFLKYISDVWQDHYEQYQNEYGDEPELIEELMKNERFVLPQGASFYALYNQRYEPGNGERIDQALHAIEEANGTQLKGAGKSVFQDISFNTEKLGEEKQKNTILRYLLADFAKPELNLRPGRVGNRDVIGNACECLIKKFANVSRHKAEGFYTPPEVSDLIAELLDPQPGDAICDPVCGSGSLLLTCAKKIRDNHSSKKYELYGQEAVNSTWALAKINMFLHGEDNHKIEWGDAIRNPKLLDKKGNLMLFDVVIANPPFGLANWGYDAVAQDKFGRFKRGLPPRAKGDFAFISHMVETLKPKTGVMGVVVPQGVLFRGASEGEIRKKLIDENLLDAVISLPEKLFYESLIPATILIFKQGKETRDVMFIDASREYKIDKHQNYLTQENIRKIVETYREGQDVNKYAYVASLDEIRKNDYKLNISQYVNSFEEEEAIDLVSLRQEREKLKSELKSINNEMDKFLREIG